MSVDSAFRDSQHTSNRRDIYRATSKGGIRGHDVYTDALSLQPNGRLGEHTSNLLQELDPKTEEVVSYSRNSRHVLPGLRLQHKRRERPVTPPPDRKPKPSHHRHHRHHSKH